MTENVGFFVKNPDSQLLFFEMDMKHAVFFFGDLVLTLVVF
jgi:hypothetical protein